MSARDKRKKIKKKLRSYCGAFIYEASVILAVDLKKALRMKTYGAKLGRRFEVFGRVYDTVKLLRPQLGVLFLVFFLSHLHNSLFAVFIFLSANIIITR